MVWNEVLKAAPPVVQAVSVAVTAFFAVKSLNAWHVQLVGKRRFEAAEEVITAVYDAREAFAYMRRSYYIFDNTQDRLRPAGELEMAARQRDICFVIGKRFNEVGEKFIALQKARLLCQIHFGNIAVQHIDELFKIRNSICVSLELAIDSAGSQLQQEADTCDRILSTIRESDDQTDKLSKQLASAIAKIEEICTPHLRS